MKLHFYKYQGAGNDFVVIDGRTGQFDPTRERVAFLCNRRMGVVLCYAPVGSDLDALRDKAKALAAKVEVC